MLRIVSVVVVGVMNASFPCFAQITETDTMKVNVQLSLNGNWSSGNVERILLLTQGEGILGINNNWIFKTHDTYRYGKVRSNRTEDDFIVANYLYHKPFNRLYFYLMMLYETNLVKTVQHRIGGGPGMTFVLLKSKASLMKISLTAFVDRTIYRTVELTGTNADSRVIDTWRPALRIFERHNIDEKLTFFYEFTDQVSISRIGNHRLFAVVGINFRFSRIIDFTSRWTYTHEDIVPQGVKADDYYLTFGVNLHYQQ